MATACSSVKPSSLSRWTNFSVSKWWSRARGGVEEKARRAVNVDRIVEGRGGDEAGGVVMQLSGELLAQGVFELLRWACRAPAWDCDVKLRLRFACKKPAEIAGLAEVELHVILGSRKRGITVVCIAEVAIAWCNDL